MDYAQGEGSNRRNRRSRRGSHRGNHRGYGGAFHYEQSRNGDSHRGRGRGRSSSWDGEGFGGPRDQGYRHDAGGPHHFSQPNRWSAPPRQARNQRWGHAWGDGRGNDFGSSYAWHGGGAEHDSDSSDVALRFTPANCHGAADDWNRTAPAHCNVPHHSDGLGCGHGGVDRRGEVSEWGETVLQCDSSTWGGGVSRERQNGWAESRQEPQTSAWGSVNHQGDEWQRQSHDSYSNQRDRAEGGWFAGRSDGWNAQHNSAVNFDVQEILPPPPLEIGIQSTAPSCTVPCGFEGLWCKFDVSIPNIKWQDAFLTKQEEISKFACPETEASVWVWPQGCRSWVADTVDQVKEGLAKLRESMMDRFVSIDLEWKGIDPDSLVALMQLASSTFCLLVRTSSLDFELPLCIREFLRDPEVLFVGFGWDASDDDKLAISFNLTKKDFGCFLDLREVTNPLGYVANGITSLTEDIMGSAPRKSKKTTMSNWERSWLTPTQMAYASWDVFTCGLMLRQLRLWHASHEACTACGQLLGHKCNIDDLICSCGKRIKTLQALFQHCKSTKHKGAHQCDTCRRLVMESPE